MRLELSDKAIFEKAKVGEVIQNKVSGNYGILKHLVPGSSGQLVPDYVCVTYPVKKTQLGVTTKRERLWLAANCQLVRNVRL